MIGVNHRKRIPLKLLRSVMPAQQIYLLNALTRKITEIITEIALTPTNSSLPANLAPINLVDFSHIYDPYYSVVRRREH